MGTILPVFDHGLAEFATDSGTLALLVVLRGLGSLHRLPALLAVAHLQHAIVLLPVSFVDHLLALLTLDVELQAEGLVEIDLLLGHFHPTTSTN